MLWPTFELQLQRGSSALCGHCGIKLKKSRREGEQPIMARLFYISGESSSITNLASPIFLRNQNGLLLCDEQCLWEGIQPMAGEFDILQETGKGAECEWMGWRSAWDFSSSSSRHTNYKLAGRGLDYSKWQIRWGQGFSSAASLRTF